MKTLSLLVVLAGSATALAQAAAPPSHLHDYIAKDDGMFAWKLIETTTESGNTIAKLSLTSQTWQGETWTHDIDIILAKGVSPTSTVLLMNDGGKSNPTRTALGLMLAQRAQVPVVYLYGIPKQPLYGKREDALIAETFVKYLETKDSTWPLLLPMVKSVVKCMDAVQAYAKQEWKTDVNGFIITGASKRGWTSWLTAASGDPRVKAIAPMVFDSLNLMQQMPHQVKSFGRYSQMIRDYEERKLLPLPETEEARQLWMMVDPWIYREKITIPKLLINGTNDPYWTQDALNFYWNDLKGPKAVLYVPNAGHDLRPMDDPKAAKPVKDTLPMKAIDTLASFARCVIAGRSFPALDACVDDDCLSVTFQEKPQSSRVWKTTSDSRDFRKSLWKPEPLPTDRLKVEVHQKPESQFIAEFVEADFEIDGRRFSLSSPIRIIEKK